jgi:hypothetical protein
MAARNSCFPALHKPGKGKIPSSLPASHKTAHRRPASPDSPGEDKTGSKRLLLLGIDGCRPDCLQLAHTPNIDTLLQNGAYSLKVLGDCTGRTIPGWYTVLSGVRPEKHRLMNDDLPDEPDESDDATQALHRFPTFIKRLAEVRHGLRCKMFSSIEGIHILCENQFETAAQTDNDDMLADRLISSLRNANCPDVLVGLFQEVDVTGHHYGFSPEISEYIESIQDADLHVGKIMSAVQSRKQYGEDWLVVVCTTHGGILREDLTEAEQEEVEDREAEGFTPHYDGFLGVHLLDRAENTTALLIAEGTSVKRGELIPAPGLPDIAAMVFTHFDVPIDLQWQLDAAEEIGHTVISSPYDAGKYISYAAALRAPANVPASPPSPSSDEGEGDDASPPRCKRNRHGVFKRHSSCRQPSAARGPALPTISEDSVLVC